MGGSIAEAVTPLCDRARRCRCASSSSGCCPSASAWASRRPTPWSRRIPTRSVSETCGINVTLILDASGSVSQAHAVENVRDSARAFLEALADTSSTARVIDFGTVARVSAPRTIVTTASLQEGGVFAERAGGLLQPEAAAPAGRHGPPVRRLRQPAQLEQLPERQRPAVHQLGPGAPPGARGPRRHDRLRDRRRAVGHGCRSSSVTRSSSPGRTRRTCCTACPPDPRSTSSAIARSRRPTRTRPSGPGSWRSASGNAFGNGTAGAAARARLVAVSGPQVVTDANDITSLNEVDVALVEQFDELQDVLRQVVTQLCAPSLTILKLSQTAGNSFYEPTPGWDITASPAVATANVPAVRMGRAHERRRACRRP